MTHGHRERQLSALHRLVIVDRICTPQRKTRREIVGLADVGRLAPGYSADFVVLDADPLDDITNTVAMDM